MIDGMWWLVILLIIIAVLWLLAHRRGAKNNSSATQNTAQKRPTHDALQKTAAIIKQHFADYRVTRRESHLMLSKKGKKIAMITIDTTLAAGQRRLGDVPVINYHRVPSRAQLDASLQPPE